MLNRVIELGKVREASINFFTFSAYLSRIEVRINRPSSVFSPFLKPSELSGKVCRCSTHLSNRLFSIRVKSSDR